jgi:heme/copper-type cytochrome/quinol oxidase subunit 2
MEMPVILILVGIFAVVTVFQVIILRKYLNQRREELKQHK